MASDANKTKTKPDTLMRGHTSRRHFDKHQSNSLMRIQSPGKLSLMVFEIFTLIRFSFNNAVVGLHQRYMFLPLRSGPLQIPIYTET